MRAPTTAPARLACALLACAASGCQYGAYFFRATHEPMQALHVRMDPAATRDCVVVFLPGMLNTPDTYLDNGFVDDAVRASRRCDIVSTDAHYGYYRHGSVSARVGEDILRVARRRGYETIWLVGSSMGAIASMRVARDHPELVDGVVLLGPWFGDGGVVDAIRDAGGLERWPGPETDDPSEAAALWDWMRGYATHPNAMPPLYIAMGADDGMREASDLLAPHLPAERYGLAPGGHAWETWRVIWRRLLVHPPWDPDGGVPRLDR